MEFKKGDRVLYNRQKFGTVHYSTQYDPREVNVVFDRENAKIVAVRADLVELVADAQHEAHLAVLINSPSEPSENPVAGKLAKLADELTEGADWEKDNFRLRTTMKTVADRLRYISENL